MKGIEKLIFGSLLSAALMGCGKQENRFQSIKTDANEAISTSIVRMDKDIYQLNECITRPAQKGDYEKMAVNIPANDAECLSKQLDRMESEYGDKFHLYLHQLGAMTGGTDVNTLFYLFLSHPAYESLYQDCEKEYNDVSDLEQGFSQAFSRAKQLIPSFNVPSVCTFFSGFAEYIAADSSTVYISLEYFLGEDYENYKHVPGIYDYMIPNLRRERIVPEATFNWFCSEYNMQKEGGNLLDNMIHFGKMLYVIEAILPEYEPTLLMGYSKEDWEWCEQNEKNMWNYLREYNQLFSTDAKAIADYIFQSNCTKYFSDNEHSAPSRAALWIGWKIVKQYMNQNPNLTLEDLLLRTNDGQEVLQKSGYRP